MAAKCEVQLRLDGGGALDWVKDALELREW